jgi:hypothetical protein
MELALKPEQGLDLPGELLASGADADDLLEPGRMSVSVERVVAAAWAESIPCGCIPVLGSGNGGWRFDHVQGGGLDCLADFGERFVHITDTNRNT